MIFRPRIFAIIVVTRQILQDCWPVFIVNEIFLNLYRGLGKLAVDALEVLSKVSSGNRLS